MSIHTHTHDFSPYPSQEGQGVSLYIHVPFCAKRCFYCSFYSTTCGKREREGYVEALLKEMESRRNELSQTSAANAESNGTTAAATAPTHLSTIYLGGGTPSQLDDAELHRVFTAIRRNFTIAPDAEITMECNPDDLREGWHAAVGINRISLGVQSFDDGILSAINRRHSAAQAIEAVKAAHREGIHNVSIDLIYGLPGQTFDGWRRDVDHAAELSQTTDAEGHPAITHLSSYCLSIEPGTHLHTLLEAGKITEADEDEALRMYDYLVDTLKSAGFEHYEISNFALPGFHSRHNSNYWRSVPYIGLGPGAHSYDGRSTRRWNLPDLHAYCKAPLTSFEDEHLSPSELYDELIMTRLRTAAGLPLRLLSSEEQKYLLRQARRFVSEGLLQVVDDSPEGCTLKLTRKGIFTSDAIFSDLMSEE